MKLQDKLKGLDVLVTGGAGFVGSNIVSLLLEQGAKVTVLDNLFTGMVNLLPESTNLEIIIGDVEDNDLVDSLVKKFDYIILMLLCKYYFNYKI